ncbi:hypothetical protein R6Q59_006106 [Mikania micrantha]
MVYQRGDRVEVLNEEEGFVGSYYPANIISRISTKEYIVQYRTLVNDDGLGPLREVLSADRIRPKPPEIVTTGFGLSDMVDASDHDGWWVGKVVKKMGSEYLVRFENPSEKIAYPMSKLRVHQEWKDGVWVYCKK